MRDWVKGLNELIRSEGHICSDDFWSSAYVQTKNYQILINRGVVSNDKHYVIILEIGFKRYKYMKLYEEEYDLLKESEKYVKEEDEQELIDELKSYCK